MAYFQVQVCSVRVCSMRVCVVYVCVVCVYVVCMCVVYVCVVCVYVVCACVCSVHLCCVCVCVWRKAVKAKENWVNKIATEGKAARRDGQIRWGSFRRLQRSHSGRRQLWF